MTDNKELFDLVVKMRSAGALITVKMDDDLHISQGRDVIDSVQITNVKGIGPHPMSAIAAAEAMRQALAEGVTLRAS